MIRLSVSRPSVIILYSLILCFLLIIFAVTFMRLKKKLTLKIFILLNKDELGFIFNSQFCISLSVDFWKTMAWNRDLRSYFSVTENVIQNSRISIPGIISSASNDVSQREVDMSKEVAKKREAERKNYQNVPEEVQT